MNLKEVFSINHINLKKEWYKGKLINLYAILVKITEFFN